MTNETAAADRYEAVPLAGGAAWAVWDRRNETILSHQLMPKTADRRTVLLLVDRINRKDGKFRAR